MPPHFTELSSLFAAVDPAVPPEPAVWYPWLVLLAGAAVVVVGIVRWRLHAFLALIFGALVVSALAPGHESPTEFIERVAQAFGRGAASIGIVIAMAAIIGKCLLDSGAAERVVLSVTRLFGERRTPQALTGSSFILGIPVFFDTVFYLLMPLGKALRMRTGGNYTLYILAIIAGATMAHSLVPPTPGPLLVAGELGVSIGSMMLAGLVLGVFTVTVGYLYAVWANRRWEIPLRPTAELTEEEARALAERKESDLPGLGWSLMPIALPVVLIGGATVWDVLGEAPGWFLVLGDKNLALILSAVVALLLLARQQRRQAAGLEGCSDQLTGLSSRPPASGGVKPAMQRALESGGVIILITSAGSAFGAMINQAGVGQAFSNIAAGAGLWLLVLAFLVTVLMRVAQGSATVAMITAVGIVAPVLGAVDQLAYHPVYLALAIGCGSKPLPWANDSGFWVISRMTGMTEIETFKTFSLQLTVMGVVGILLVLVAAVALPMV